MTTAQASLEDSKADAARIGGESATRKWRETIRLWRQALDAPHAQFAWVAVTSSHPAAPYSR